MSSAIDLCNSALAEIGTQSTISSFDEASAEAVNCKLFYDPMRKSLLRTAPWGFSRKQAALSVLDEASNYTNTYSPFYPWLYSYEYPADCMKLRYLTYQAPVNQVNVTATDNAQAPNFATRKFRFFVSTIQDVYGNNTKVILCNVPNAIGVYNYNVDNVDLFDPQFREALITMLAYKLVIPLSGNVGMKDELRQLAEMNVLQARASDGNESLSTTAHTPDWIQTRGYPPLDYYGGMGIGASGDGYWGEPWDSVSWGM